MIADLIAAAFVVTMLTVLVRPGSAGSTFVVALTNVTVAVIKQVTDIADGSGDDTSGTDGSNDRSDPSSGPVPIPTPDQTVGIFGFPGNTGLVPMPTPDQPIDTYNFNQN